MSDGSFASLFDDVSTAPTQSGHVPDILSLEEAWASSGAAISP